MSRVAHLGASVLSLALCLLAASTARGVETNVQQDWMNAPAEDIAAWRKLKFGLFIHWGPVSLKGTEIGWSRGGERRGRGDGRANGCPDGPVSG